MSSVVKRTITGGGGYLLTNLAVKGLGFGFIVAASRLLGSDSFGVLALALSVQGLVGKVAALGLPVSIQRLLSGKGEDEAPRLYGSIIIMGVLAGLAAGGLLFALAPILSHHVFSEPDLTSPLRVMAVAIGVVVPYSVGKAVLQAKEEVKQYGTLEVIRAGAKLVLVVVLVGVSGSAVGAAWAVPGSIGLGVLVALAFLRRLDLRPVWADVRFHARRVLRYSLPLVVVGFSYFLAQQADRLMLGMLAPSSAVGIYTVISTLAFATTIVHKSLITVFMPVASQAYRRGRTEDLRVSYLVVGKWAGIVNALGLLVFVTVGPFILGLFGADYVSEAAYTALIVLASLYFLGTWVGPTGALLQMSEGHNLELLNTVVFVVVNVVLNLVLIPRFGIVGAATATFTSGIVRNALQFGEIRVRLGFYPVDKTNLGVLGFVVVGLTLGLLFQDNVVLQAASVMAVLVTLSGYVILKLDHYERELVERGIRKAYRTVSQ